MSRARPSSTLKLNSVLPAPEECSPKLKSVVPAPAPKECSAKVLCGGAGDQELRATTGASAPQAPLAGAGRTLPEPVIASVDALEVSARGSAGEQRDLQSADGLQVEYASSATPHCSEACEFGQLGQQVGVNLGRKTLVLDLDETLVHSSFRYTAAADITIEVELEGELHKVYVRKRPGVDEFLQMMSRYYEVVVYTASLCVYANPLLDVLDADNVVAVRLFRDACTRCSAGYVKDLSKLGRDLKDVIIIDNSPLCYALQPENAIPIKTWRDDMADQELIDLVPILCALANVDDIPMILAKIMCAAEEEEEWSDDADAAAT